MAETEDETRERRARAYAVCQWETDRFFGIQKEHGGDCTDAPITCNLCLEEEAYEVADAIAESDRAAGYRLVPEELTDEMEDAFDRQWKQINDPKALWRAMLDAAPGAKEEEEGK